jgi:hypothetical protein
MVNSKYFFSVYVTLLNIIKQIWAKRPELSR